MSTPINQYLTERQLTVFKALLGEKIQMLTSELSILNELIDVQKSLNTPVNPAPPTA